jgi:hypothetical protein
MPASLCPVGIDGRRHRLSDDPHARPNPGSRFSRGARSPGSLLTQISSGFTEEQYAQTEIGYQGFYDAMEKLLAAQP